jgi:two-component system LytT family sensor kinase
VTLSRKILNVVIHVAAWSVFIILWYLILTRNATPFEIALHTNPWFVFVQVFTILYLVAFYYLNAFVFIPRLLANKHIWVYAIIVVCLLVVYIYVPEYVWQHRLFPSLPHPGPPHGASGNFGAPPPPGDSVGAGPGAVSGGGAAHIPGQGPGGGNRHRLFRIFPIFSSATLFLLIFVISSGVKIIQQWFTAEQMKDLAEKEKLRTELSLLKSQVNPHFLFNTLNNIYAMAITQSENTADAVMKLAQIMRYILQDAEIELVPVQKDIEFIQHYIELQQFRLSDKVDIAFTITGNPSTLRIAPLLLIPFVENAFKYGVSARQKTRIAMDIRIEGNIVTLWVQNSKPANAAAISKDNTGIGINNTKRRLALLYPDKHELQIIDQPDQYTVTLKINCA